MGQGLAQSHEFVHGVAQLGKLHLHQLQRRCGTAPTQLGQIQLANFINYGGLQSLGENLFQETAASGAPQINNPGSNGLGVLNQSFTESSNVNVAEELVNMIVSQRAYELNSRAITTSDQMLQRLTQL